MRSAKAFTMKSAVPCPSKNESFDRLLRSDSHHPVNKLIPILSRANNMASIKNSLPDSGAKLTIPENMISGFLKAVA